MELSTCPPGQVRASAGPRFKIHQLKALVTVADTGSIRAASRAMCLSPAAVTKAVRELEEDIGTVLVLRENAGIRFTAAGRALLVHARVVLAQLERAEVELVSLARAAPTVLRVGVAAWIAMSSLGDVIQLVQQRMPAVRLELFEGVLTVSIPKLRDGTLDLCVGRSAPAHLHGEFAHVPLFRTSSAVVARRGHPLATCRSLEELRHAEWMLNWTPADEDTTTCDLRDPFQRFLREYRPKVHVAHSLVIATSLVRNTEMLALMPWPLIEMIAVREGFCTLPISDTLNETDYSLITRSGVPLGEAARCFMDCFRTVTERDASSVSRSKRRVFDSLDALAVEA